MKRKGHIATIIGIVALCVVFCIVLFAYSRFNELENKLMAFDNRVSQLETAVYGPEIYSPSSYNYLAIGNSITIHGKCDYWWNESGMAASQTEKDYFHRITAWLEAHQQSVTAYAINFASWEIQAHDRAETYEIIKPYLSDQLDLVTVQLSENVNEFSTFEKDFSELIAYITANCPGAEIIVIDDVWNDERSALKQNAAKVCDVSFVSLAEIRRDNSYSCGMGTIVYGEDGEQHTVEHSGVARHPGDMGMKYIADAVILALQETMQTP